MAYSDSPEERKRYHREWMKAAREKDPERYRKRETEWRSNNPATRLIYSTKQTAKKKGIEHNITEQDLILPEKCPFLGTPIDYSAGTGKTMDKPSVDRIDPTKGYIQGNVEVISSLANSMKNKATPEELLAFATEVLKRYGPNLGLRDNN